MCFQGADQNISTPYLESTSLFIYHSKVQLTTRALRSLVTDSGWHGTNINLTTFE